jgi:hypothetical protein
MASQVSAKSSTPITQTNSSAADLLASAMDEAGGGLESDAGDLTADAADSFDDSAEGVDIEAVDDAAESSPGDEQVDEAAEDASETAEGDENAAEPNVVEVDITDEQGKRKIELDLSDKQLMIRNAQQAAGARKLYKGYQERGETIKQRDTKISELTETLKPYEQLEDAYQKHGIDGVVQLLEKKSLDELVEARAAWQKKWAAMSPAERQAWQAQQDSEKSRREVAAARAEADKAKQTAAQEREAAKVERLEGWAHEQFHRFSFAGKLGDKTEELRLDRALWNHMQAELGAAEAAGTELTRDVVKQVAGDAAAAFRRFAQKSVQKGVAVAKAKQKQKATEAAQTAMVRSDKAVRRAVEAKGIDVSSTAGISQLMAAAMSKPKRGRK